MACFSVWCSNENSKKSIKIYGEELTKFKAGIQRSKMNCSVIFKNSTSLFKGSSTAHACILIDFLFILSLHYKKCLFPLKIQHRNYDWISIFFSKSQTTTNAILLLSHAFFADKWSSEM